MPFRRRPDQDLSNPILLPRKGISALRHAHTAKIIGGSRLSANDAARPAGPGDARLAHDLLDRWKRVALVTERGLGALRAPLRPPRVDGPSEPQLREPRSGLPLGVRPCASGTRERTVLRGRARYAH